MLRNIFKPEPGVALIFILINIFLTLLAFFLNGLKLYSATAAAAKRLERTMTLECTHDTKMLKRKEGEGDSVAGEGGEMEGEGEGYSKVA